MSEDSMKEGVVDMGEVSAEDPIQSVATEAPAKKARSRKPSAEGATVAKEPVVRTPVVGDYGKRGLPHWSIALTNDHASLWADESNKMSKHHQRVLIYSILSANGSPMTAEQLVLTIENSAEYLQAMRTNQSVARCVLFQINELQKAGIVATDKPARTKKEEAEASNDAGAEAEAEAQSQAA